MKLYNTPQELYDDCMTSEAEKTIIVKAKYSEDDDELLGYYKYYVD